MQKITDPDNAEELALLGGLENDSELELVEQG